MGARRVRARAMKKTIAAAKEMGPRGHVGLYGLKRNAAKRKAVAGILKAKRRGEKNYQLPFTD